jgi:phosphoribosyl 1,2-cyclic phosphodiesterase
MRLTVVASSSHGNCYLLEAGNEALLLECGVKIQQIKQALGFDFSRVCGCLVSHEHKDHAKAARDVMMAGVDLFCSSSTAQVLNLEGHRLNILQPMAQATIGSFTVLPFPTEHDAAEPLGFLIQHPAEGKLIFLTDSYYSKYKFTDPSYIMIECNYCLDILQQNVADGLVPEALKNRILQSHFSLEHVKQFLQANVTTATRQIILVHLSDDNSDAARMQREVQELTGIDTVVADAGLVVDLSLYPF